MEFLSDLYPKQFQYLKNVCLNSKQPNSIIISGSDYNLIRNIALNYAEILTSPNKYKDIDNILEVLNRENINISPYIHIVEKIFLEDKKRFKKKIYRDDISLIHSTFKTKEDNFRNRVCIIDSLDDLALDASNSLLKIIEEPNNSTYFILLSHKKDNILSTIKSRSHSINFNRYNFDIFQKIFKKEHGDIYGDDLIYYLYQLSKGSREFSDKFVNSNLNDLDDHFKKILENNNFIKHNTADHYIDFITRNKFTSEEIINFFNYCQLKINYEIQNNPKLKRRSIASMLDSYQYIDYIKNMYSVYNLKLETCLISLFSKLKNV
tara:strand:- start:3787 stop:4749 length:963 start_codon:yes stop_codon:yes gene_type:complete